MTVSVPFQDVGHVGLIKHISDAAAGFSDNYDKYTGLRDYQLKVW